MNKKTLTLSIMIDALRHDFVDEQSMPFLYSLQKKEKFFYTTIEETFGFIGVRGAVFAGLYPKDSKYVFLYKKRGQNRFLSPLFYLGLSSNQRWRKGFLKVYNRIVKAFDNNALHLWNNVIPSDFLKEFELSEKCSPWDHHYLPGHQTIFDYLDDREYVYMGYPNNYSTTQKIEPRLKECVSDTKLKFIWVHFSEVDWIEHKEGASSHLVKEKLREIDNIIYEVYQKACENREVKLIVFGDHGCLDVIQNLDIVNHLELKSWENSDLLYFVDSTMVRFWSENTNVISRLKDKLNLMNEGSLVSKELLENKYYCEYDRDVFGDLLFVANEGVQFFPNFFTKKNPPKGMHGYLPEVLDNKAYLGVLCPDTYSGKSPITAPADMTTVFDLIVEDLKD